MTLRAWDASQRIVALIGLIVLSPLLVVIAAAVRVESPGPAFFRSIRVGPHGTFVCLKFRSMRAEPAGSTALGVTAAGDPRVTRVGCWLRRTKLDELPQLWNVVRGEMLFVGPRPEDPRYVDRSNPDHAEVFGVRPGITGPTALAFADEERRLREEADSIARPAGRDEPTPHDVEVAYRDRILPLKVASDREYLRTRTVGGDLRIVARTFGLIARRARVG